MVNVIEASFDISFDKPLRAVPSMLDLGQGRMATVLGAETVRVLAKLRFVVCFQDGTHDFLQQFVGPDGNAEWSHLPIGLGNILPPLRRPSVSFMTYSVDDRRDLSLGHTVRGFCGHSSGHRTGVSKETPVRPQVQIRVEELSIDLLQWQPPAAPTSDDL